MTKKVNRKSSARRKLIPAVGMLTVSAMMLSSATYAWFTMSREVEVTGLNMTATVPEDLQISLGTIGKIDNNTIVAETSETGMALVKSTGYLVKDTNASNADNGTVLAPTHSWDWSNSADISAYYRFGKLMPASSTTGEKIYFTADASGVGRTVKNVAKYYAANTEASGSNLTALPDGNTGAAATVNKTYAATLHALTDKTISDGVVAPNDGWVNGNTPTYAPATDWNKTFDDGYYIDVPVWIRSSGSTDTNISVAGYVIPGSTDSSGKTETELELYRSVRVAILNGDTAGTAKTGGGYNEVTTGSATVGDNKNIIPLVDAWDKKNSAIVESSNPVKYTSIATASTPFTVSSTEGSSQISILDSGIYDERWGLTGDEAGKLWGVASLTAYTSTEVGNDPSGYIATTDNKGTYGNYTAYDGSAIATIKCAANSGDSWTDTNYGVPKKLIIRVWLDGEDTECWNDNAGQDWAISLKFSKIETTSGD